MAAIFKTRYWIYSSTLVLLLAILLTNLGMFGGQVKPVQDDDTPLYMRAKLASTEKVLEGLVTENFEFIKEGSAKMHAISKASRWPQSKDQVYNYLSQNFRDKCNLLIAHAEKKDLESAHQTYLQLSTSCIECHNYVRGRFKVEQPKKAGPFQLIPTEWDESKKTIRR